MNLSHFLFLLAQWCTSRRMPHDVARETVTGSAPERITEA
jgi:hypothetical protein